MPSIDLYSKRKAQPCSELIFDKLSDGVRIQINYLINNFFNYNHIEAYADENIWTAIQKILKQEHKKESLTHGLHSIFGGYISPSAEVMEYIKNEQNLDYVLDAIELVFRVINNMEYHLRESGYNTRNYPPESAISDLNTRFKENCIGYKFENDIIIKIDNEFLYSTITKDVMIFLTGSDYVNVNEEYINAHKHFRDGNHKDCIVNCCKAFESTMKVICQKKKYAYSQTDTAKTLIDILYNNKFIPDYLKNQLAGLRAVLTDGVSVIRNQTSGHGAGAASISVDESLCAYALNITGSTIKFFISILERK